MTVSRSRRTVVMGVGNILMGDEGIGVHVIRRLQEQFCGDLELIEGGTVPAQSLANPRTVTHLVLVDAVDAGGPPGAVYRIPATEIPRCAADMSAHHFTLSDTLTAWHLQGLDMQKAVIIGVQPADVRLRKGLSDTLTHRFSQICDAVLSEAGHERMTGEDDCQRTQAH